jgi:hypothetical protein
MLTRIKRKVSGKVVRVEESPPMKARKRRKKSARTLRIEKLDTMWSLAVRLRDNYTDRKTGVRDPRKGVMQAMHIFGRSNYATRWLTDNGLTGGYYTHILWGHRHPVEFTQWAEQELGPEAWARLVEASKQIVTVNAAFMDEAEKRLLAEIDDLSLDPNRGAE